MPPKSSNKKLTQVSWYHCEACDVHITYKQRETHEENCPIVPDENHAAVDYIHNGIFCAASVERRTFIISDLSELPTKWVNKLIFVSEGAMRLARFHIGQQVVVESAQKDVDFAPLVRILWPIPEKFLATVFVSDEDFNANWSSLKDKPVKIQALSKFSLCSARTVSLQIQENETPSPDLSEVQLNEVERLLKFELRNSILTAGSLVHYNFFNASLKLLVTGCVSLETAADEQSLLTDALAGLKISNTSALSFFKVVHGSNIRIERKDATLTEASDSTEESEHTSLRDNIGGMDEQLNIIENSLNYALGYQKAPRGIKLSRGLLLHGPTGCGKTMICEAISADLQRRQENRAQVIKINTTDLLSRFLGESEKNLSQKFEQAFKKYPQPTLLVVEDVHNICPKQENSDVLKRVAVTFASLLDSLSSRRDGQTTFVLATTSHIDELNASVRRCGRLDCEVEIGTPTPKGRTAILNSLLRRMEHNLNSAEVNNIAHITHGFVGADLSNLVYSAALLAVDVERPMTAADVHASLLRVKPSAMREVLIESPNIHWSDIGGQADLKLKLQQAIEWPLLHPEKFTALGIKPPRGILMYGPPGCSKTMVAKALATESQLNFLSIKGPELFSMWVGESERAVREVFRKARQVAPAIVFFDEIDAIGGERSEGGPGGSGSSVKERVLTQLLTELDGVETLENVTVVAATNRPDMIDRALLRPGRIDRIVYVGLPDEEARREILRIKLQVMPLAEDVAIAELVKRTAGYSGAELQAVCHEAALKTLEENIESQLVSWRHFEFALDVVQPRTSPELLRLYEAYQKKV